MVAAAQFPVQAPTQSDERRILLHDVPWSTYVVLRDSIESPSVRMTYLKGQLEIMSPSREHEVSKKEIARLVELFCFLREIPLYAYGSTTFRREEKERGLEPDECYSRDRDKEIPDLALEVIVSHGLLDKLEVYAGLGIREVWLFQNGKFEVLKLSGEHYEATTSSAVLPELDLDRLAFFTMQPDQHVALRAFADEVRR